MPNDHHDEEPVLHEADLVTTDEAQAERLRRLVARVIRSVMRPDQYEAPRQDPTTVV